MKKKKKNKYKNLKPKKIKVNLKSKNLNYKNVLLLRKFISPEGKILPRRLTQIPLKKHKKIINAIKNARILSFIPFKRMTFY